MRKQSMARYAPSRCGSILIMVMVVLMITGLIASQTIHMLWTTSQNDRRRERLLQARELIELGKIVLEQGDVPESGEVVLDVDGVPGKIRFQILEVAENSSAAVNRRFRIVAEYGDEDSNQAVATWETGQ